MLAVGCINQWLLGGSGIDRPIIGFQRDDDGHWVARLSCAHLQHVRHRPPFEQRPWTQTEAGRRSRLGTVLGCVRCDDSEWPDDVVDYKTTPVFDQDTVPKGLLAAHTTKAGVWARIEVLEGSLRYTVVGPPVRVRELTVGQGGVIVPEVAHEVAPLGRVRFRIVFAKAA